MASSKCWMDGWLPSTPHLCSHIFLTLQGSCAPAMARSRACAGIVAKSRAWLRHSTANFGWTQPLACPSSPRSIAATWCTACQSAPPARHQSLHIWPLIFSIGLPDLKCIPLLTQATDTWFGAAANKPQLRDPWSLEDKVAASKIFLAEPSSNTQLMQFAGKAASSKQAQLL